MSKNLVWSAISASLFVVISVLQSLAGNNEIALVTGVNAVALSIISLRDK